MRLRRHLRTGASDRRCRGLPPGRHRPRERARCLCHPLPGRQLRLRLPLGGQRRPAGGASASARPRLALHRDQRGRPARVLVVARQGRQRAHARRQSRHPWHARGARPPGVLEHQGRHGAVRPPRGQRPHRAVRRAHVVPRQRDGRPMAARPPLGRRLRQDRLADRQGAAAGRPRPRARGVRILQRPHADLRRVGAGRAAPHLRRRRLHLVPRVLRGAQRRPRQLPRLGGRHGRLHRDGHRHGRPRRRGQGQRRRRSTSRSTSGTSGTSTATTASTRSRASTTGRSRRACSKTPTRWRMPSSSATS